MPETYQLLDRGSSDSTRWSASLALPAMAGVTALATALRVFQLGSKSFWIDECASLVFARQPWLEFWKTMWRGEANMLAYYLMLRTWIHLGATESVVRGLSVLPALGTVWLAYLLGKRLSSVKMGLISALLLAVNACHVAYSQEARGYALLIFLCTLSLLTFVVAIEHSTVSRWFLYALTSALAVYTHFFAGLLILAQWSSLFLLPARFLDRKKFLLSALGIVVACLPAAWFVLNKDAGQLDFIPNPGLMEIYRLLLFLASDGGKVYGVLVAIIYLVCLAGSLRVFLATRRNPSQSTERWKLGLLWSSLVLPVFMVFAVSCAGKQMFYYRYLLICLPPLVFLVSRGYCSFRWRYAASAGLFILCCLCLATVWRYYSTPKEDWREATRYLLRNSRSNETVLVYPIYAEQPIRYYETRLGPQANTLRVVPAQLYSAVMPGNDRPRQVWLLSCRQDSFLRAYRSDLSRVYSYHSELQYDGSVVLEEYSDEELTSRNRSFIRSGAGLVSGLDP